MWAEFFPQAMIFGMDKNINYLFDDGRIRSLYGNQSKPEKLAMIMKRTFEGNKFDIIIDDGSHKPDRQIKTLSVLLPYLRNSGLYFVEDVRGDKYVDLVRNALPDMFDSRVYRSVKPDSKKYGDDLEIEDAMKVPANEPAADAMLRINLVP